MNRPILLNFKTIAATALMIMLAACSTVPLEEVAETPELTVPVDHSVDVAAWKSARIDRLQQPFGWLSLVGLLWLEPGENTIGSAASNDIVLKSGPSHWGTIVLDGDAIRFITASDQVTVDGKRVAEVELIADVNGTPNVVISGTTQFFVIKRGSYALRVKDSESPVRVDFAGLDYYPVDESWKFDAKFTPAPEGATIPISNVLGQLDDTPLAGTLEFEKDGKKYSLLALVQSGRYFFIVADRTNGHGTYGAGRFIYTDFAVNGRVSIDFNKAYNPPCAFTEYSTCSLPPPQNRLPIAVTAGEKEYRGKH